MEPVAVAHTGTEAASALGGATGVMLGGLLAVPVSVAAIVLASHVLEEGPVGTRRRLDGRGAVTITGAVVALVHGALAAADHGWTSPTVIISLNATKNMSTSTATRSRNGTPSEVN